jgi:hypothetical protein
VPFARLLLVGALAGAAFAAPASATAPICTPDVGAGRVCHDGTKAACVYAEDGPILFTTAYC